MVANLPVSRVSTDRVVPSFSHIIHLISSSFRSYCNCEVWRRSSATTFRGFLQSFTNTAYTLNTGVDKLHQRSLTDYIYPSCPVQRWIRSILARPCTNLTTSHIATISALLLNCGWLLSSEKVLKYTLPLVNLQKSISSKMALPFEFQSQLG